jgi:tight adherence protein B
MMVLAAACVGMFVAALSSDLMRRHTIATTGSVRSSESGQDFVLGATAVVLGYLVLMAVTGTTNIALPMALGCFLLPRLIASRRRAARHKQLLEAWPDALRSIRSSLLAGRSLHTSLVELVENGPAALRPVVSRYERLAVTLDQNDALEVIRDESADPFVDRIIEVLIAASDAGPATVIDIMNDLADAALDDLALRMRVDTAGLEQRLNAAIIMSIPILLLLLLNGASPIYSDFYASSAGLVVVMIGMGMAVFGMVLIRRLSVLPAEPRVFGRDAVANGAQNARGALDARGSRTRTPITTIRTSAS